MEYGGVATRTVVLAVAGAALGGLLVGALIGTVEGRREDPTGGNRQAALRPEVPPFVVLTPTSTPRPDHPSPDLGKLVGARKVGGTTILRFDRVTVRGSGQTGYTIDNKAGLVRQRKVADNVRVIGGEKLTNQPSAQDVTLATLLRYLERSGDQDPLLVWLSYGGDGRVVEVREQNLP